MKKNKRRHKIVPGQLYMDEMANGDMSFFIVLKKEMNFCDDDYFHDKYVCYDVTMAFNAENQPCLVTDPQIVDVDDEILSSWNHLSPK